MRKVLLLAVVCTFWLILAGKATADSITYHIDVPVGVGSVMGTITTDGDLGTLLNGDITSWNLTLNDGTGTATLSSSNPADSVFISGGSLSASAGSLFFDFNGSGSFVNFNGPSPGCPPQWSIRTGGGTSCNGTTDDQMGVSAVLPAGEGVYSGTLSGVQELGVIPEPSALFLLGSGLLFVGIVSRKAI